MRDFDPLRIASEWHSGQGSALYAYASTDRIPTEEDKDRLVSEIEHAMAHADDAQLDELEYLLMHVEESHPDRYPDSEMHEGDGMCVECGGMKMEGTCECAMAEADREPSTYDYDDREMSIDQKRSAAAERGRRDARKSPYDDPEWKPTAEALIVFKAKRAALRAESVLRQAIASILGEMKLGVAGRNHFDFGGAEEVSADDVAHMLLGKKDPAPEAPKSGVRAKKSSKRKSKKTA